MGISTHIIIEVRSDLTQYQVAEKALAFVKEMYDKKFTEAFAKSPYENKVQFMVNSRDEYRLPELTTTDFKIFTTYFKINGTPNGLFQCKVLHDYEELTNGIEQVILSPTNRSEREWCKDLAEVLAEDFDVWYNDDDCDETTKPQQIKL